EWAMPSTASFTSTSMCSPSSLPCQSAAASSGYRDDRPARTLRTVAPGVSGSSRTRRPVPSPPTNFVTQEATSTGTVAVASTPLTHEEEEDLEPREVRERLEGLHVVLPRLESRER